MSAEVIIRLVGLFAIVTGLLVEALKKLIFDKKNLPYNILALVSALIVSIGGSVVYMVLKDIPFTNKTIIDIVIMGFFSAIGAMVGFDKLKEVADYIKGNKATKKEENK